MSQSIKLTPTTKPAEPPTERDPLSELERRMYESCIKGNEQKIANKVAGAIADVGLPVPRGSVSVDTKGAIIWSITMNVRRAVPERTFMEAFGPQGPTQFVGEQAVKVECGTLAASVPVELRKLANMIEKSIREKKNGSGLVLKA